MIRNIQAIHALLLIHNKLLHRKEDSRKKYYVVFS